MGAILNRDCSALDSASAIATGLVVWLLMRRVNWYFLAYVDVDAARPRGAAMMNLVPVHEVCRAMGW